MAESNNKELLLKVGVIIVNLNRQDELHRCLVSLLDSNYPHLEILIVDNGSNHEVIEMIKHQFPQVALSLQSRNLGFTGGNNFGVHYFIKRGIDYLFLLNNDAVIEKNTILTLVKAAEANPQAGFLGPLILSIENPNEILSAGVMMFEGWDGFHRGSGELEQGQYDRVCEVDYLSGCALLVKRYVIEKIGILDPDFFAYYEDAEWCLRGKKAGIKAVNVPSAKAWHPDTRRRDEYSPLVTYYIFRNKLLLASKQNFGWKTITKIILSYIRIILSWSIRPKWKKKRKQRDILLFVIRDFIFSHYGPMASDVERICSSKKNESVN